MLALAASRKYDVQFQEVTRAFLQTEDINRNVYVKPPAEAVLPENKWWRLVKPVGCEQITCRRIKRLRIQCSFISLASKLNMLSLTSRPDFSYQAKALTTKYGNATKSDFTRAVKLLNQAKQETTRYVIPDLGDEKDWILLGVTDASNKSSGSIFPVGGHVIMILNKVSNAAAIIHWSSKKIDRVVASSLHAETLSMHSLLKNMYFARNLGSEIVGDVFKKMPGLILTDNQDLFSCVHNLKSCEDKRLLADIISIRQAIYEDKTISEVRYVESNLMIADCLTKVTKTGKDLIEVVRSGHYSIPGGSTVRDSTLTAVKTWNQLVKAEMESGQEETNAILNLDKDKSKKEELIDDSQAQVHA